MPTCRARGCGGCHELSERPPSPRVARRDRKLLPSAANAQGTPADYARALGAARAIRRRRHRHRRPTDRDRPHASVLVPQVRQGRRAVHGHRRRYAAETAGIRPRQGRAGPVWRDRQQLYGAHAAVHFNRVHRGRRGVHRDGCGRALPLFCRRFVVPESGRWSTRWRGPGRRPQDETNRREFPLTARGKRSSTTTMSRFENRGTHKITRLSTDGSEADYYELSSIAWSPDSKKLAAYRVRPGYRREVHYVESSPADQLQPKYTRRCSTRKPGDVLDVDQPVLFDVAAQAADRRRQRALSERVRQISELVVAEGQPRLHVRVQPARPPGLSRHRSRRGDRQGARGDLRRAEDVLLLSHGERQLPTQARSSATTSTTARRSSGCRSATAGTTSICTTAPPAR